MCRPSHFQVEYQINPWMELGAVNTEKALLEWETLVRTYQELGVTVEFIEQQPHAPDMVFATDQSVVIDASTLLLSRFRYPERQPETDYYREWYLQQGYTVQELPDGVYLEGGDVQRFGDRLLVGTGFRTSGEAVWVITQLTTKETIALQLVESKFYHLDTCLFVLDQETVFYYPPAFSHASQDLLRRLVPQLIEFTIDDVLSFAANSVRVDRTVLMHLPTDAFKDQVEALGYTHHSLNVSEFIKAGGGIHCLTGELG